MENANQIMGIISIIATVFSVAIPLLLQVVTKIDKKYNSSVIVAIFKRETLYVSLSIFAMVTIVYVCFASLVWLEVFNSGICKCVSEKIGILLCCSDFCVVILSYRLILTYYDANKLYDRLYDRIKKGENVNAISDLAKHALRTSNIELSQKTSRYFSGLFRNESKLQDYGYMIDEINNLMCEENLCDNPYWGNAMTLNYYLNAFPHNQEYAQSHIIWNLNIAIKYNQDKFIKQYWDYANQFYWSKIPYQVGNENRRILRDDFKELHVVLGALLLSQGKNVLLNEVFIEINDLTKPFSSDLFPNEISFLKGDFNFVKRTGELQKKYGFSQISEVWAKRFYIALFFWIYSRLDQGCQSCIVYTEESEMLDYIKEINQTKYRDLYYPFFHNPDKIDEIVADICK